MNNIIEEVVTCKKCKKEFIKKSFQNTAPDIDLSKKENEMKKWCFQCQMNDYEITHKKEIKEALSMQDIVQDFLTPFVSNETDNKPTHKPKDKYGK